MPIFCGLKKRCLRGELSCYPKPKQTAFPLNLEHARTHTNTHTLPNSYTPHSFLMTHLGELLSCCREKGKQSTVSLSKGRKWSSTSFCWKLFPMSWLLNTTMVYCCRHECPHNNPSLVPSQPTMTSSITAPNLLRAVTSWIFIHQPESYSHCQEERRGDERAVYLCTSPLHVTTGLHKCATCTQPENIVSHLMLEHDMSQWLPGQHELALVLLFSLWSSLWAVFRQKRKYYNETYPWLMEFFILHFSTFK